MDIYFTLDYELFLGDRTGTPNNCLVKPMELLCEIARKHNFSFVIFIDAAYLLRMQQLTDKYAAVRHEYDMVIRHVEQLVKRGHDLQLHFHPQWLYSTWNDDWGGYEMDREHYKLSDMESCSARKSLIDAKNMLDNIVGYKTCAFRAGGFCLDSFIEFKNVFSDMGIRIDSSVARYRHISSPVHSFDYRNVPTKQIYRFEDSLNAESANGSFIELSISGLKMNFIEYAYRVKWLQHHAQKPAITFADGIQIKDFRHGNKHVERLKRILSPYVQTCTIDGVNSELLHYYYIEAKRKRGKELIMIGHPKCTTDTSVKKLDEFLTVVRDNIVVKTTRDLN